MEVSDVISIRNLVRSLSLLSFATSASRSVIDPSVTVRDFPPSSAASAFPCSEGAGRSGADI